MVLFIQGQVHFLGELKYKITYLLDVFLQNFAVHLLHFVLLKVEAQDIAP